MVLVRTRWGAGIDRGRRAIQVVQGRAKRPQAASEHSAASNNRLAFQHFGQEAPARLPTQSMLGRCVDQRGGINPRKCVGQSQRQSLGFQKRHGECGIEFSRA